MQLLTFQSKEVVEQLAKGDYFCDRNLHRENRDYCKDIEQLDGYNPIWCFRPKQREVFDLDDFKNGNLFERYRCEMSLTQKHGLTEFYMIEFEIDSNLVKLGLTHNAYLYAVVVPYIKKSNVKAIYKMLETRHWYNYKLKLLVGKGLFPDGYTTLIEDIPTYAEVANAVNTLKQYCLSLGDCEDCEIKKHTGCDNKNMKYPQQFSSMFIEGL